VVFFNSIKFNKTDIGGLREARFENSFINQLTGLAILSNVYDVEIKCAGNTMFYPGMKIYVDPRGLSPEMGNPARDGSISLTYWVLAAITLYTKFAPMLSQESLKQLLTRFLNRLLEVSSPGVPSGLQRDEEDAESACDESIGESVRER
jgi:hypothetical protein